MSVIVHFYCTCCQSEALVHYQLGLSTTITPASATSNEKSTKTHAYAHFGLQNSRLLIALQVFKSVCGLHA